VMRISRKASPHWLLLCAALPPRLDPFDCTRMKLLL
jgi:hypothetical protein